MSSAMNAYDTDASGAVQTDLRRICNELMAILTGHGGDVNAFQSEFDATDVADMYREVETRFGKAGREVANIITLVQDTLLKNDGSANDAITGARSAVAGMG